MDGSQSTVSACAKGPWGDQDTPSEGAAVHQVCFHWQKRYSEYHLIFKHLEM